MLRINFICLRIFLLKAEKYVANIKYPSKVTLSIIDIFRRMEAGNVPVTTESQNEWQKRVFQILKS